MQSLVDNAAGGFRSFLMQRDDLILIVSAADGDMPAGLKILEGLDAQLSHVWGWIFAEPFSDRLSYTDAIIGNIAVKQMALSATLQKQGKAALPPVPETLRDPARDPVNRLQAAVVYLRSLAPRVPGRVTLFALMPLEIRDPAAYGELARDMVRHGMPFPWCAGVRFILRDDAAHPMLMRFAKASRARSLRIDLSPATLQEALSKEALDMTLPADQRMKAALIAAGMDQAHGRISEACARYETVMEHYGAAGNATMAVLAAEGIAACKEAGGDKVAAERILQAALNAATQGRPLPLQLLLNILRRLMMLVARQGRWAEVEIYLTTIDDLANALFMPAIRAEALTRRGIAQIRLGKAAEAERSWRDALAVADKAGETKLSIAAHKLLLGLLQQSGRDEEARHLAREYEHLQSSPARPPVQRQAAKA
jgi:hypothetical protein